MDKATYERLMEAGRLKATVFDRKPELNEPHDPTRKSKHGSQKQKLRAQNKRRIQPPKKSFVRPEYFAYIRSAKWKKKRTQAFECHGRKCQICGATERLTVHHKTYERLGREEMQDLEVLCRDCLDNHHEETVVGCYDPLTREFRQICG